MIYVHLSLTHSHEASKWSFGSGTSNSENPTVFFFLCVSVGKFSFLAFDDPAPFIAPQ